MDIYKHMVDYKYTKHHEILREKIHHNPHQKNDSIGVGD